jgi:uncharacterized membrane protein
VEGGWTVRCSIGTRRRRFAANLAPDNQARTPRNPTSFLLAHLQNQKLKTMTATVQTERELASAIKRDEDTIEITGDLANKTVRIRATGGVAWAIAFATIGLAVYATITRGVTVGEIFGAIGGAVSSIFGVSATYFAIALAVGGISVLMKRRVAWAIVFVTICLAIYATIRGVAVVEIVGAFVGAIVGAIGTAFSIFGVSTYYAIAFVIGAGGVSVLRKLRRYKEVSRTPGLLVLKRM